MLLALDYGEKRIGVAVTDENGQFPTPLNYISNRSKVKRVSNKSYPKGTSPQTIHDARKAAKGKAKVELRKLFNKILHLINCYYPEKILIGLPMSIDKNTRALVVGKQAIVVRRFAKKLESFLKSQKIVCDILLIEESMSSVQARANLKQLGLTENKIKEKIDSESARILLEEYITNSRI